MDRQSLAQASDVEIREYLNRAHRRRRNWQIPLWAMLLLVTGTTAVFGYMANASMILKTTGRGQQNAVSIWLPAMTCGVCGATVAVCSYYLRQRLDRQRIMQYTKERGYELIGIEPIGMTGSLLCNDGDLQTLRYRITAKDGAGNMRSGEVRLYSSLTWLPELDLRWQDTTT